MQFVLGVLLFTIVLGIADYRLPRPKAGERRA